MPNQYQQQCKKLYHNAVQLGSTQNKFQYHKTMLAQSSKQNIVQVC